jgi:hypothetical protein
MTDKIASFDLLKYLMYLGPALLFIAVWFGSELQRSAPEAIKSVFRWTVLTIGLLMSAFMFMAWPIADYVVGGRPGNEGAGMLGTLIFLFVGLPGLAIVILAALKLNPEIHEEEGPDA